MQGGNIAECVEDSKGCASIIDDLVCEESRKFRVVLATSAFGLACARKPLEQEDEGMERLERGEGGGIK